MKITILLMTLFSFVLAEQSAWSQLNPKSTDEKFSQLQVGSVVYTNATVTSKTSTHIFIIHSGGVAGARLMDLSPELQKKFGFDPTKVEATNVHQIPDVSLVKDDGAVIQQSLKENLDKLLDAKNFDGLNKLADDLRNSKAQTADGLWHLAYFYEILYALPKTAKEPDWKARIQFLTEWVSSQPDSITARVALARCYVSYGWHARGSGYANTVTEAMHHLFQARLVQANQVLLDARELKAKCPVWWSTMQVMALGSGWDRTAYENIFASAIKYDRTYVAFYNHKASYLLPRWYGEEGEWQKFAIESADKIGGEDGDMLYARMGWHMHKKGVYDAFLRDAGYSWPRLRKGLEIIIEKYPDSNTALNELAYFLSQKNERESAKPLFQRIGGKADDSIWSDKERFLRSMNWAMSAN